MNNLQVFRNLDFGEVRVVEIQNEGWLVGRDVAEILGYTNTRDALRNHVDDEDKGVAKCDTLGGKQDMVIINESGLYSLVLSSKLPSAKKFKKWVTSEVLPSIRKHGMYAVDDLLNDPDAMIAALQALKAERAEKAKLQERIEKDRPKVIFAEALEISSNSILVGELAKLLKQNGINVGQNRLFEILREQEYLIKRRGEQWNMPTQKSMEMGLFEIKKRTINNPDGSVRTTTTPKITGKGQIYFINKFKELA